MPTTEDRQVHLEHVDSCQAEASDAVAASTRYERECAQIESTVEPLLKKCVEYYDQFRMWEATADRYWAEHPEDFESEAHCAIEEIARKWQAVFRLVTDLADTIKRSEYEVNLPSEDTVSARYAMMLSVELMDNSPLPKHLSELAESAVSDYEAGQVEEVVRP